MFLKKGDKWAIQHSVFAKKLYSVFKHHQSISSVMQVRKLSAGFTLIELLVVIAIIGVLSSVVLSSMSKARERGKVGRTVAQIKQVHKAVEMYVGDTGELPPPCRLNCTAATDPLLTNVGNVPGWDGPYIAGGIYNRKHQWGGHIGIYLTDHDGNGEDEVWIILDDDAPGTSWSDNSGRIPESAMQALDEIIDDGDTATGAMFVGDGAYSHAAGEVSWRVSGVE